MHTITAFATETRLVLRQMSVSDKSNEIPAARDLLSLLELEGSVVTLDAMHCQKATAAAIVEAKADYVLTVKRNQESLSRAIEALFVEFGDADYRIDGLKRHVTVEESHGRQERREHYVIDLPDNPVFRAWTGAKSIGMIYRQRSDGRKEHDETTYFISSLPPKVKRLGNLIRDHWKIENSEHYVLDVTFSEDASRIRKGSSPEVSAAFRRMALNILQRDSSLNDSIRGKRLRAGWDDSVLDAIYAGFSSN